MQFSIIIPTFNEEKEIESTVRQFTDLNRDDLEVIVTDDGSTDATKKLAVKSGAVFLDHKEAKSTIAANRNFGAKHAKGKILIFCDADTTLENPNVFLVEVANKFKDKKIVAGVPSLSVYPHERRVEDVRYHAFFNALVRMSFRTIEPVAGGQCQVIRRTAFKKVLGYNEDIPHGEDTEIMRRLKKVGNLYHFTNLTSYESSRRYRKYGYPKMITMGINSYLYRRILSKNLIKEWERVD